MTDARRSELETLIARTAMGDRDAFDRLYDATSAKLHAVCLSVLKDRPEAEETLQEVYIRVWQSAARYASNGLSPMTWLITIARNRSIDRLRARGSRPVTAPEDAAARNMRQLVLLRWLAVGGQCATILTVHYGLGIQLPVAPMAVVLVNDTPRR